MKLKLRGHEERYALEQLQLSLFPEEPMEAQFEEFTGNRAESALFRGKTWLTPEPRSRWTAEPPPHPGGSRRKKRP